MFGGLNNNNNNNNVFPPFLNDTRFQLNSHAPNPQLQLFGNNLPVNSLGNEHNASLFMANKRGREVEDLSRQQKLPISLNYNLCPDEVDRSASIPNHNPVSTGLRLSYDDDEHNSSITSTSGSMAATPSILFSLGDDFRRELERQKEEFDQYVKYQEEQLAKGVRDIKQRHMVTFLKTIEEGMSKKIQEKETELDNINRKNKELMETIKQVTTEANNWQCRAKYNESVVNILKNNLQTVISNGIVDHNSKEGFGDSEVDDATSYIDPTNHLSAVGLGVKPMSGSGQGHLTCRACRSREVSVLLFPCRHLCLCRECEGSIRVCPVCNMRKSTGVEVFLS